jgi:hypothetical protein
MLFWPQFATNGLMYIVPFSGTAWRAYDGEDGGGGGGMGEF